MESSLLKSWQGEHVIFPCWEIFGFCEVDHESCPLAMEILIVRVDKTCHVATTWPFMCPSNLKTSEAGFPFHQLLPMMRLQCGLPLWFFWSQTQLVCVWTTQHTLPKINIAPPLKIDDWKMIHVLLRQKAYFHVFVAVSCRCFREDKRITLTSAKSTN